MKTRQIIRPFHSYTMKKAVQERLILDVLKTYGLTNQH